VKGPTARAGVRTPALVAAIAATGLLLRLAGVRWGLPNSDHYFSYHPDEVFVLVPSLGFAHGEWNPRFFNYGTLYLYLVGIPAVALGLAPDPAEFPAGLRHLHLLGRLITALMGAATVPVLYWALRGEGRRLAALAAALLALCPLHIVNSHYATVDVPATFWLTVALAIALSCAARPSGRGGLLLGMAVGLAAATKYNAGLFLLPAALAPVLAPPRSWRWSWGLGVLGGAVVGFIIGCPYFWTEDFRRGVLFELQHARVGGTLAFVDTGSGWVYHLLRGLPAGLGYGLVAAVALGVAAAVALPSRAVRLALVWSAFYLLVIGAGRERFIRYLVPLTPFLAVLGAAGLLWPLQALRRPHSRFIAGLVAAVVVALTALYSAGLVHNVDGPDPRDQAWHELRPAVHEGGLRVGFVDRPWFWHPPVSPYNGGPSPYSRPFFERWNEMEGGRLVITGWDVRALTDGAPDYFVLADLEAQDLLRLRRPEVVSFLAALDDAYRERTEYRRPTPRFAWLAPGRHWAPPDWLYASPHIIVYSHPEP